MSISVELFASICALLGTTVSGVVTIIYWLVKIRKDLDAAHSAIRDIRKKKARS